MSDERGPEPQAMSEGDRALAIEIDRRLQGEEIYAAVRVGGGVAYLDGVIESAAQRDAASDLALSVAGITRVQNDLDVEEIGLPGADARPDEQVLADVSYQQLSGDSVSNPASLQELTEPDYNEPIPKIGEDMTTDSMIAAEEGIPYAPPTDPVVRPSLDHQTIEVVGGFGMSSDEEYPDLLATTALGEAPPGDDDLRQQVIEALRADAATTELVIDVSVRNGRAYLRGEVQSLDDSELAEEVAGRVPGIREVVEELTVADLG